MTLRTLLSLTLCSLVPCCAAVFGQEDPPQEEQHPLIGRLQGERIYVAPHDVFRVQIPVYPELGGTVSDTENVVTFQDSFTVHTSIACFAMDASLRWEDQTRGRKDFLTFFLANYVVPDFQQRFPGSTVESAKFRGTLNDGTLITFLLLPGGTMFGDRLMLATDEKPPVAKRSNWVFIKNEHIFIVSMELAERVLERSTWNKKPEEEDEILSQRIQDFVAKISFPPPTPATK